MKYYPSVFRSWLQTRKVLKGFTLLESTLAMLISSLVMLMAWHLTQQVAARLEQERLSSSEFERILSIRQRMLSDQFSATYVSVDSNTISLQSEEHFTTYQLLQDSSLIRVFDDTDTTVFDRIYFRHHPLNGKSFRVSVWRDAWHIIDFIGNYHSPDKHP